MLQALQPRLGVWEKPLSGTGRSTAVPRRDSAPAWADFYDFYQALCLEEPSLTMKAGICTRYLWMLTEKGPFLTTRIPPDVSVPSFLLLITA